jgi:UDP-2-acetamido-2-deoxy-ribo-hexuluronate aminotransferase
MRKIRVHGQDEKHIHPILGLNARLDTLQAAVLLSKLTVFDDEIALRQKIANYYRERLQSSVGDRMRFQQTSESNTSVFAQFTLLSPDRDVLLRQLEEHQIPSVNYYSVPLHLQPVFAQLEHREGDFPVAESVSRQCLSLPMGPYLSKQDIDAIVQVINACDPRIAEKRALRDDDVPVAVSK